MPDENDTNEFKHDVCNLYFENVVLAKQNVLSSLTRRGAVYAIFDADFRLGLIISRLQPAVFIDFAQRLEPQDLYPTSILNYPATPFTLSHDQAGTTIVKHV
jgi:hypothetical protein